MIEQIDVAAAAKLVARGAVLVDVRSRDEHARERIAGARHHALATLGSGPLAVDAPAVIFHCRSGMRTAANTSVLSLCAGGCDAYLLEGGLDAWKRAGLPVEGDVRQPLELDRQVQIAAGNLIALGALLGFAWAPGWFLLPAAIGAGLVFAGISGTCGLARLLVRMPWNRALRNAAAPDRGATP